MNTELSQAYSSGAAVGRAFAGFLIPVVAGYFFLWFSDAPKRNKAIAAILRLTSVVAAVFLAFAGYVGSGGQINYGSFAGVTLVVILALRQQLSRRAA